MEEDFSLTATSDKLGHITLQVELRSGPYPQDWTLRTAISIDAGNLERIADDVGEFLAEEREPVTAEQ